MGRRPTPEGELTPAQARVLALVAYGLRGHEIARELHVAQPTVAGHMRAARARLGTRTTAHTVAVAIRRGLLPDNETTTNERSVRVRA